MLSSLLPSTALHHIHKANINNNEQRKRHRINNIIMYVQEQGKIYKPQHHYKKSTVRCKQIHLKKNDKKPMESNKEKKPMEYTVLHRNRPTYKEKKTECIENWRTCVC